ncbi:MAG: GntR family transcriptional regulator [Thermodesulfobacteriota bacterium]
MTSWDQLPDVDKNDYKPLYVQLSDLLTEYIRHNGLAEGHPLPSENDLLSRYDLSRSTIRQAMQRLESQDVVRKVRGKGTFVAAPKHRKCVRGFQNVEETLAEQGIIVVNRLLRFEAVYPPRDCVRGLQLAPGKQAVLIRRLKLIQQEPLALEERYLPFELGSLFNQDDFRERPVFEVVEDRAGIEIAKVTYSIASSPLTDEEAGTLKVDPGAPVLRRTGLYYDREGHPCMFGRLIFLADKMELRFEFQKQDVFWAIMALV